MPIARSFPTARPFHWPLDIRYLFAAVIILSLGGVTALNQWHVFMPLGLRFVYSFLWMVGFAGTFEGKLGLVTLVPLLGLFAIVHYARGDRWQTVIYVAGVTLCLFCWAISFALSFA